MENWLQQEEEAAKLHSAPAVLNPLPAIRGANHLGAAAAAADPAGDAAAPGGRKAHERLSSKDLFSLKGGATGAQATAVVKAKAACVSAKRSLEEEAQTAAKKRKVEAHAANIILADATVATLEGEAPWTAALLGKLGAKELSALIARKGARPKGKKADFVAQVSAHVGRPMILLCSLLLLAGFSYV